MNCKEGDLAIVVTSYHNNHGKIVRCLKCVTYQFFYTGKQAAWITEPMLSNAAGNEIPTADHQLRPIRNEPGADETLSWKDVPQEVAA